MTLTARPPEITVQDLLQVLELALADYDAENAHPLALPQPVKIRTFAEAGLLTDDSGLVVKCGKTEFQITVVQSK